MKNKWINLLLVGTLLSGVMISPVSILAENVTSKESLQTENTAASNEIVLPENQLDEPITEDSTNIGEDDETTNTSASPGEPAEETETTDSAMTDSSTDSLDNVEDDKEKTTDPEAEVSLNYETNVESIGWQKPVKEGEIAGTTGRNLAIEGIKINFDNAEVPGGIQYKAHVQNVGWQDWVNQGELAGVVGKALPTEAYQIKLTGELAEKYDVYYRVHTTNIGWLDWAKNGEMAGSEGFAYRIESVQIQLVPKGEAAPGETARPYVKKASISYQTYGSKNGWQNPVTSGQTAGSTGKNLMVEGLKINIADTTTTGSIQYRAHVQNIGWQDWVTDGVTAGVEAKQLPTEAYQIRLTGELANTYDVFYRVHSANLGWLGWTKNGEMAGSEGFAYQIEAVQISLVPKYGKAPSLAGRSYIKREKVTYRTHVKNIGWQKPFTDGQGAGTTGKNLWIEGLELSVADKVTAGSIQYRAHVRNIGWQGWSADKQLSGTVGRALPTEAYQIRLTGELSKIYHVYYRVHAQNFGWLGWARNGQSAGTEGYAYHAEALQIKLVPKGSKAPGPIGNAFKKNTRPKSIVLSNVPYVSQYTPVFTPWGCAAASMTMPLRARGVKVDLKNAQDNLPMYPQYPGGQKGNVYTGVGFGWVITPQTLTDYMKRWYKNVENISGTNTKGLINQVLDGNPVLYYGFSSYQKPGDNVRNHVKVILGYKNDKFLVHDPLYYKATDGPGTGGKNMKYDRGAVHWLPISDFNKEYNSKAIVIK